MPERDLTIKTRQRQAYQQAREASMERASDLPHLISASTEPVRQKSDRNKKNAKKRKAIRLQLLDIAATRSDWKRDVLEMKFGEGLSTKEIAKQAKKGVDQVNKVISKAFEQAGVSKKNRRVNFSPPKKK